MPEIPEPSGIARWSRGFELKTFLVAGTIALSVLILAAAFTFRGTWSGWFGDQSQPLAASQGALAANAQPTPVVLSAQSMSIGSGTATPSPGSSPIISATPSIAVLAVTATPTFAPTVVPTTTPIPTPAPVSTAASQDAQTTPTPTDVAPATTPAAGTVLATPASHAVIQGETLTSIGQSYGVSVALIAAANHIGVTEAISNGTTLFIPSPDGHLPPDAPILGVHLVVAGDNLGSIAARFGVSVQTIMAANGIVDANHIEAGQVITIPKESMSSPEPTPAPQTTYTVQPGDTLYVIARRFGVTVESLMAANGLTDRTYVRSGQVLIIPAG